MVSRACESVLCVYIIAHTVGWEIEGLHNKIPEIEFRELVNMSKESTGRRNYKLDIVFHNWTDEKELENCQLFNLFEITVYVLSTGDHILRAVCSIFKYVSTLSAIQSILEIKHLRLKIRELLYNVIKTKVVEESF